MLIVVGLSVIMLGVIMPSVIGLSVVAPRRLLSKVNIQSVPCFWEGPMVARKICGMQEMFELTFLQWMVTQFWFCFETYSGTATLSRMAFCWMTLSRKVLFTILVIRLTLGRMAFSIMTHDRSVLCKMIFWRKTFFRKKFFRMTFFRMTFFWMTFLKWHFF